MRGMPFHKSLTDQANSVKISGYSKKANALIQVTIYARENDPILEWGQSRYQSLAATTNSRQEHYIIFRREGGPSIKATNKITIFQRVSFVEYNYMTVDYYIYMTFEYCISLLKRPPLLRCKQMSFSYSAQDKYLQGTQNSFKGLCLSRAKNWRSHGRQWRVKTCLLYTSPSPRDA